MLTDIVNLIRKIFSNENNEKEIENLYNNIDDDIEEITDFNKSGEILIHNKNYNHNDFSKIVKYSISKKELSKIELMKLIELNIFFLNELINDFQNTIYTQEYNKLRELLNQSNSCFNIVEMISDQQVFYKKTISTIKKHTDIISLFTNKVIKLKNKYKIL